MALTTRYIYISVSHRQKEKTFPDKNEKKNRYCKLRNAAATARVLEIKYQLGTTETYFNWVQVNLLNWKQIVLPFLRNVTMVGGGDYIAPPPPFERRYLTFLDQEV